MKILESERLKYLSIFYGQYGDGSRLVTDHMNLFQVEYFHPETDCVQIFHVRADSEEQAKTWVKHGWGTVEGSHYPKRDPRPEHDEVPGYIKAYAIGWVTK